MSVEVGAGLLLAAIGTLWSERNSSDLCLLKRPFSTTYHFLCASLNYVLWFRRTYLPVASIFLLALVVGSAFFSVQNTSGPHVELILYVWFLLRFFVWWCGLGILSSIGLGTGMHSGLLFVFPHAYRVAEAANRCGNMSFNASRDLWVLTGTHEPFPCVGIPSATPPTFLTLLLHVMPVFVVWGCGTAIGEIPPYALSYAAQAANEKNHHMEGIHELRQKSDPISRMQIWMLDFMEKWGFLGIISMAAWPNAAFDMCGIVAGHLGFSFWKFFGATLIGKGFIKAPSQGVFFSTLFWKDSMDFVLETKPLVFIQGLVNSLLASLGKEKVSFLAIARQKRTSFGEGPSGETKTSPLGQVWAVFMVAMIMYFVLSVIGQVAESHRQETESVAKSKKD